MREVSVKFEFDEYEILADGEVYSPADIRHIDLTFIGVNKNDIDRDTKKIALELAREVLADSVYNPEMSFE
jgi:hypothetical protein